MQGFLHLGWFKRFSDLLKSRQVRLIHAHEFDANIYAAVAGLLAGIPVIATVHGRNYYGDASYRRIAYKLVSRAATMVAVSDDAKRFLLKTAGISAHRVRVVRNGIAASAVVAAESNPYVRAELGIRGDERVLTVVGSLYPVKGHRYLLEALPAILTVCPSTVLLIAGRGDCEAALRDQAGKLGIGERVRFLGLRTDIANLLAISDVFILPSLSEGLSIAILEAMAAGRPVVTTKVGGTPELVLDGETGLLVAPTDVSALSAAAIRLLLDPAEARRLGAKALERVKNQFKISSTVKAYETIYQSLLSHSAVQLGSHRTRMTKRLMRLIHSHLRGRQRIG